MSSFFRTTLCVALPLFAAGLPAEALTPDRWTQGYSRGTFEAGLSNNRGASFTFHCADRMEGYSAGMFVQASGLDAKVGSRTEAIFVVDGVKHRFDFAEIKFDAKSEDEKKNLKRLALALIGSKARTFIVEFPQHKLLETFSLRNVRTALGTKKSTILDECLEQ